MFNTPEDFAVLLEQGRRDYEDSEFPPSFQSIYTGNSSMNLKQDEINLLKQIEFKPISQTTDSRSLKLFDKIEPSVI